MIRSRRKLKKKQKIQVLFGRVINHLIKRNIKMKIYRPIYFIVIIEIFLCFSCSHITNTLKKNGCDINVAQIWNNDSNRLKIIGKRYNSIGQLVDNKGDSTTFGVYDFYKNGALKSYRFFVSDSLYGYREELDTAGNITSIEGSPLVTHLYRQVNSSIVEFTFLFSSLNTTFHNITIRTNTGIQFPVDLLDNAAFTNMKSVTFSLPVVKNFNSIEIFTSGDFTNTCLNKQWNLRDTVNFKKAVL